MICIMLRCTVLGRMFIHVYCVFSNECLHKFAVPKYVLYYVVFSWGIWWNNVESQQSFANLIRGRCQLNKDATQYVRIHYF